MLTLAFILGREPALSVAELATVLGDAAEWMEALVGREALVVPVRDGVDARALMRRLGGMVKIGEALGIRNHELGVDPNALVAWMNEHISAGEGKRCFGFSVYDLGGGAKQVSRVRTEVRGVARETKRLLRETGHTARWVTSTEPTLSSVVVAKNRLLPEDGGMEILFLVTANGVHLARTLAVQPFEEWGRRDFGKPSRSMTRGMLPPKLARIMINTALGRHRQTASQPVSASSDGVVRTTTPYNDTSRDTVKRPTTPFMLLDPFCGTGTVLLEALALGCRVIGTDRDPAAITEARANLAWAGHERNVDLTVLPVECLSAHVAPQSVDAIVTEPTLGPARGVHPRGLDALIAELHTLYITAFREFARVLKPGGRVVFITPIFRTTRSARTVDITNDVARFGFRPLPPFPTPLAEHPALAHIAHLDYARPDQRTGRRILRFSRT